MEERKHECQQCEKKFKRAEHLKRHINVHLGLKPFSCLCGKCFGRKDELLRHRRTHRYTGIELILQESSNSIHRKLPFPKVNQIALLLNK